MASLNSFVIVLTFVLSFALWLNPSVSSENISPTSDGPSSETSYAPRPLSSYEKYLVNCVNKLKPKCGDELFFGVFFGNQTVSNYCCHSLVSDMGKSCHTDVTKHTVKLPMFKKNEAQILNRCENIWNDCSLVNSPQPKPYVLTPTIFV